MPGAAVGLASRRSVNSGWSPGGARNDARGYCRLPGWTLSGILHLRTQLWETPDSAKARPGQRVVCGRTRAAQGHRLRAAGGIVRGRNCPGQAARSRWCEGHEERAGSSGGETRTAGIGLPKVGGGSDARKAQCCCAVVVQPDGLRWAGCAYKLGAESQADR